MLLMVEKGIRSGICHAILRYAKANNKYLKNYDKNIESSYLMYINANNLYGQVMSQKLPLNGFEWVKKLSKFNERSSAEDFIKNLMNIVIKDIFLQQMSNIRKIYSIFIKIFHSQLKHSLQKHMVRKHYYNFCYLANMLKTRSRGFDRAQYYNVNQIQ